MIQGSLKNLPLTDMFQLIANSQKSGIMTLTRFEARARIYFDLGRISYAHMTPGNHLGEIMVRMDMLTFHDVQELLKRQRHEIERDAHLYTIIEHDGTDRQSGNRLGIQATQ